MSASPTAAAPSTSAGEGVNTGAPAAGQATQPAPTGDQQQPTTEKTFTQADVDALIKARLAEERRKADKAKADAELPELAKRDARIAELEESLSAYERKARDYALKDAIAATVASDDFPVTPVIGSAQLLKLLDTEKVEWAEDGTPKNAGNVLAALARSAPALFQAKPRRPGPSDGGYTETQPTQGGNEVMNQMLRGGRR